MPTIAMASSVCMVFKCWQSGAYSNSFGPSSRLSSPRLPRADVGSLVAYGQLTCGGGEPHIIQIGLIQGKSCINPSGFLRKARRIGLYAVQNVLQISWPAYG